MEDEMHGPKDEYLHNYVASKCEARKIVMNPRFEEMVAKYWQLLRNDGADLSGVTVSKEQYVKLMKAIYKVLLPLYREEEMSAEVDQEWQMDRNGQDALTLHLFTKLLFRVAHQWATHIDLEEYLELLGKIYARITIRKAVRAHDGKEILCYPTIHTQIITDVVDGEDPFAPASSGAENALWEPCMSDEEEREGFEYTFIEDEASMTVRKSKKRKPPQLEVEKKEEADMDSAPLFSMKDPINYREEVVYHLNSGDYKPGGDDLVSYVLAQPRDIVPFGYPTEQFLTWMRNDVHEKLEEAKQNRKEALARMKREVRETGGAMREAHLKKEEDGGLVPGKGAVLLRSFHLTTNDKASRVRAKAKIVDNLFNAIRVVIKDTTQLSLRLDMANPKPAIRSGQQKNRAPVGGTEPATEINKFGYNPALQRRVNYKCVPLFSLGKTPRWVNISYMYENDDYKTAYRCDVERAENANKLAIKPNDEYQRDEDFVAVETSYKKMRQIMLVKKFETLYTENLNADENDLKRIDKIVEREEQRKKQVRTAEPLNTKGVGETYEEKSLIKMMKGPFYQHASLQGLGEDDFVNSATQDLINYATTQAPKVLLLGKPRSGKTTLARLLAERLKLVHVNVENWLEKLQKGIVEHAEDEPDPETEQLPVWMTPLQTAINESLKSGEDISHEQTIAILKEEMNSPRAKTRGFVLDLTFYKSPDSWAKIIRQNELLGPSDAAGRAAEFSHVLELECDDEEIKLRAEMMRLNAKDGVVHSRWERAEHNKPKPVQYDENGEVIEEEEDPENPFEPLIEQEMIHRVQDTEAFIGEEIAHYNANERPALDDMLVRLYNHQYLKLDSAGLMPNEIADAAVWRLRPDPTVPLLLEAEILDGGAGDFKAALTGTTWNSYLTVGKEGPEPREDPEGTLPKTWSLWQQTDPVALYKKQIIPGVPDNVACYANNMFAFATPENMAEFQLEPKKYLASAPKMPSEQRLLMLGPKGIGCHTQAQKLSELYGWKVIDYPKLVKGKLESILKDEIHLPNNVVPGMSKIGLSQNEIDEIKSGKPFPAWRFIPWVLDVLGHELMKKPPPPELTEEQIAELPAEEQEQIMKDRAAKEKEQAKMEKAKAKAAEEKAERAKKREEAIQAGADLQALGLEESEEEVEVIEDLSIEELILKPDEESGELPFVGGFILLGFPQTELHAQKLKESGISFDRILFLTDQNEEEPGKEVRERKAKENDIHYDWDVENEKAQNALKVVSEYFMADEAFTAALGEETTKQINATGTVEEVLSRIRLELDPFYLRVDNPDNVRTTAEIDEEEREAGNGLPKGDFGDYCPVTYVNDNWLAKGNFEMEATVYGKTYWMAGEKELEEFKANPEKFMIAQNGLAQLPLQPPPPKVLIMGTKGAGISTQIKKLCEKYKLEELNLKEAFTAKMAEEKDKRARRKLLSQGFKAPQVDEDGNVVPEEEGEDEEFDKEAHERDLMKLIMDSNKGLVVDGTWTNQVPYGWRATDEEKAAKKEDPADGGAFATLLTDARRAPELVIILDCKENNSFERLIDKEATKTECERLIDKRQKDREAQREEDRKAKLAEVEEAVNGNEETTPEEKAADIENQMKDWEAEQDQMWQTQDDDNDPPKANLEEMFEAERNDLKEQREGDLEFMEAFTAAFKERCGEKSVVTIKTDTSADFVFIKLMDLLKDRFQMRPDLIEREQTKPLANKKIPDRPKTLLETYEESFTYKQSKFGRLSPISPSCPIKSRDHAVLYRERIYYLSDEDEQKDFLMQPSKYTKGVESIPLDVQVKPKVVILGLPKSGKSDLAGRISELTGAVHLQMGDIIDRYIERDSKQCEKLGVSMKQEGRGIDDQLMVTLLAKRLQAQDCLSNGWILEDFPRTRAQAAQMARLGVVPANVFLTRISVQEVYKRTEALSNTDFGCFRTILAQRLRYLETNLPLVSSFYQRIYNSLVEIDGFKSKWFMEDSAMTAIESNIQARQKFARSYCYRAGEGKNEERACELADIHCDRALIKASLSQFAYFCPVTWKNTKQLVKCTHNPENCLLFQNVFYYFRGKAEKEMFLSCPSRFVNNVIFSSEKGIPLRLKPHKAAEIVAQEKAVLGHCPVSLVDENKVVKGDPLLSVQYKDQKYSFENEYKLQKFIKTPGRYHKAELPVKMPPHEDPVQMYTLLGSEESTTFMEQALGSIVTRGLREVSENRLKYPNLSVKETMLKLFALFLKAENPANTKYMKEKYLNRMRSFIERCEMAEELSDLAEEKMRKQPEGKWPDFKEKYYNELGAKYDEVLKQSLKEKANGFKSYLQ